MKPYSFIDQLIINADFMLRTISGISAGRQCKDPAAGISENDLSEQEKAMSARLMRVNHAGEIAAQGLYYGQALFARKKTTRNHLLDSAHEEARHLYWCEQRITQLGGRTSLLAPVWYAGSLVIGTLTSLAGDRRSFAFIHETERQVVEHLQSHLNRLPPKDKVTRTIIMQVISDETEHAQSARLQSDYELPSGISALMRATAKIMTTSAYHI